MATGFLLVCLVAGLLVPKGRTAEAPTDAGRTELSVGLAAAQGGQG